MSDEFGDQVRATELPTPINASDWLETEPEEPDQILEGIIDVKDKLALIGSSKMRKTFFLLMLLICLATGRSFMKWRVPKPRRVVHIQYEIQPNHYHRRLKKMCKAMGIASADLGDRFHIVNARGLNLSGTEGIEKYLRLLFPIIQKSYHSTPSIKSQPGQKTLSKTGKSSSMLLMV